MAVTAAIAAVTTRPHVGTLVLDVDLSCCSIHEPTDQPIEAFAVAVVGPLTGN